MTYNDDHDPPPFDPELDALADSLRSLRPGRLDPVRRAAILVAAGRATPRRPPTPGRFWPALAASLGLVAVGEGVLLARRPPPTVVERIVVVREPIPTIAPGSASGAASRPDDAPPSTPPAALFEPGSRFDLADRAGGRSLGEVVPRLPHPSGPALRRAMFRLALTPPGGPS